MTVSKYTAMCGSVVAIVAAALFTWTGCDTDSANESVTVSPSSAILSRGQSVEFTASGGYDYTWSLSPDDGSGNLNTLKGSTVIYTCLATNVGTTPKKVIVTSTIEGASAPSTSTSTNSTPASGYGKQAFAEIFYSP
jgi:hypothetical protein